MANRFGAVAAHVLSFVLRPIGYIIFGILMVVYRRDPQAIAIFAGAGLAIAALVYLLTVIF
jgi:hypothetical protein